MPARRRRLPYARRHRCSRRVTLDLRRGEIVALVGPNGSGRRRSAKLAAGLLEPDAARVVRRAERRTFRRTRAGTSRASGATTRSRSARETAPRPRGRSPRWASRGYEARHPRDLSSGERERSPWLPCSRPSPTCSCSTSRRAASTRGPRTARALAAKRGAGRATLLVTHDHDLVAAVADRTVELGEEAERAAA